MELILNMLRLREDEKTAFIALASGAEQVFAPGGRMPDGDEIPAELFARATVILGNPPVPALRGAARLRWLHLWSAGTDAYQTPGALPEGVVLSSSTGAYGPSVSEHLFSMLLALQKRLPSYRDQQMKGVWADLGAARTLYEAQVLIVGTGDLGASFGKLCKGMGAHTIGLRRDISKRADGIDEVHSFDTLNDLLPCADVVALFLPHAAETVALMDERRLHLMKKDAIVLNGGRGSAVDCTALARILAQGHLWGAGLDVTDPEPLPADHPLWREPLALITPHVAGGDHLISTGRRIAGIALQRLQEYLMKNNQRQEDQAHCQT